MGFAPSAALTLRPGARSWAFIACYSSGPWNADSSPKTPQAQAWLPRCEAAAKGVFSFPSGRRGPDAAVGYTVGLGVAVPGPPTPLRWITFQTIFLPHGLSSHRASCHGDCGAVCPSRLARAAGDSDRPPRPRHCSPLSAPCLRGVPPADQPWAPCVLRPVCASWGGVAPWALASTLWVPPAMSQGVGPSLLVDSGLKVLYEPQKQTTQMYPQLWQLYNTAEKQQK